MVLGRALEQMDAGDRPLIELERYSICFRNTLSQFLPRPLRGVDLLEEVGCRRQHGLNQLSVAHGKT